VQRFTGKQKRQLAGQHRRPHPRAQRHQTDLQ
jgi:hypothetical protein